MGDDERTSEQPMTKLLVTSDWHGDSTTCGINRYDDIEAGAYETVEFMQKNACDGYIFLGDLSDPDNVRSHRAVALAVNIARRVSALRKPNVWVAGNHDVIEDGYGTTTLSALRHSDPMTNLIEEPCFGCIGVLDTYFVCYPFTARHQAYDAVAFTEEALADYKQHGKGRPVVILSHLNVEGAKTGSEGTTLARGRDHHLPLEQISKAFPDCIVLQGHYHKPQVIEAHGLKVPVPGSLERLRFDAEDDECGFLVVEYG